MNAHGSQPDTPSPTGALEPPSDTCRLFIYGSLRDPSILRSVCGFAFTLKPSHAAGTILRAELALLPGYRRVSPDNVYWYAVEDPQAKIEGLVIHDLPVGALKEIDRYEGHYYDRQTVTVNTADGPVEAQAYLAQAKVMRRRFGDRFHVNLIHELWLRKRIEAFFKERTRPGETSLDADLERRARRTLMGTTERDLIVSTLGAGAVSDYYLAHELDRPYPSIRHLADEPAVQPFARNYLTLVLKHVLLNEIEWHMYQQHRFEIERLGPSPRFFRRTIGVLAALRILNGNQAVVKPIIERGLEAMPFGREFDLIDYVKYAIRAADSIYDPRLAQSHLERIAANQQPGLVPLGAELEMSNLGVRAVQKDQTPSDEVFDGFRYFHDFGLNVLTWKLGGHIDDHSGEATPHRRGFLELAPGRLNIAAELSKPATADPWILNQLIHEIMNFYPVQPHSLHLSFQVRKSQRRAPRTLPPAFIKCLLALAGGTCQRVRGKLWISRVAHDEIRQNVCGEEFVFARRSLRHAFMPPDEFTKSPTHMVTSVQQYKFIRLERRANYEPLIMALKGLQLAYNPGDYLTAAQLAQSRRLRRQYEQIKQWCFDPTPLSRRTRSRFLDAVRKGLMDEAHHRPAHKLHYIDWAIGAIDVQLRLFNKELERGEMIGPPAPESAR